MTNRVFVAAYGARYESFLQVCLESLVSASPECQVDVWVDAMAPHSVEFMREAFPTISFTESKNVHSGGQYTARVSGKLDHWSRWFGKTSDGERCFLLDADVLVRKDIFQFFDDRSDILFTHKEERWPINTGVIGAVSSPRTRKFFELWRREVERQLQSRAATDTATEASGGVDQHVFIQYLTRNGASEGHDNARITDGPYTVPLEGGKLEFRGVPCRLLNQTNSVPHNDEAAIIHFKARMRQVIERDGAFNEARPEASSRDMVGMWESTYQKFVSRSLIPFVAQSSAAIPEQDRIFAGRIALESRGMLSSEAIMFAAVCRRIGVQVILESGRARGQSTDVISQALPDVLLHSIEYDDDEDARYGVERLKNRANVVLHRGDSLRIAPRLLARERSRAALLVDGPKGLDAVRFAQTVIAKYPQIVLVGIHDMHNYDTTKRGRPNFARLHFTHAFDVACFSDDDTLLATYAQFDEGSGHTPWMKGAWNLGSYGPTLGIALITWRDRERARRARGMRRMLESGAKIVPRPLRKLGAPVFRRIAQKI